MKHSRLESLADNIFAVAMTILVFNLTVPAVHSATNANLWHALVNLSPIFLSFILSFAVLFTYWRQHNFLISSFARNIDIGLTNYNALFLFLIILLPFSAEFLGRYHNTELGIGLYGLNVIAISITLLLMRNYILKSETIENRQLTDVEHLNGLIRLIFPAICAVAAMILGLLGIHASLLLFTLAVLFGFSRRASTIAEHINSKR